MIVGSLEIQLLAGVARLQKDMDDAKRIVGNTMREVERAASMARTALGSLGAGLGAAQLVQATDKYTKYTAQLKLATQSAQEHAVALAEVRRVSTLAQADVAVMGTLYARITNATKELGVSQRGVAAITETVGLALKVSGATATESASAMLQLSQAFGSGVLRGEEFNAVNEASPKLMKILAEAMGVQVGRLRELASEGKITSDVMARAFSDPRVIAALREQAKEVQTIQGAFTVLGNKFTDFIGQSATTSGAVAGLSGAVLLLANNLETVATAAAFLIALKLADWTQRVAMGMYESVAAYRAATLAAREKAAADVLAAETEVRRLALNVEVTASERAKAVAELQSANATIAATSAMGAQSAALAANTAAKNAASVATANLAALGRAQAATTAAQTAATEALVVAQRAQTAASAGLISSLGASMARFAAANPFTVIIASVTAAALAIHKLFQDTVNGMDNLIKQADTMTRAELARQRQVLVAENAAMKNSVFAGFYERDIRRNEDMIRIYDQRINKLATLEQTEHAASVTRSNLTHDEIVMQEKQIELAKQFEQHKITEAEYLQRANDLLIGGAKVRKAAEKAASDYAKQIERNSEALVTEANRETESLAQRVASAQQQLDMMGLTKEQQDALAASNYELAASEREAYAAAIDKAMAYSGEYQSAYAQAANAARQQAAQLRELAKLERAQANKRETIKAAEDAKNAQIEFWKSVDRTAHDTFVNILEGGRNAAQRLKDTFKSMFFDWLYQMTLKKWIFNAQMNATSGTSTAVGSIASALGGGSGGFQIPGLGDMAGSSLVGIGNAIGSSILSGVGTGMSIGMTAAGEAAAAYSAAGMAAEGFALQLGAAMPYIGAAIAAWSLLSGSKGTPTSSTSDVTQSYLGATRTGQSVGRFGGTGGAGTLDALAKNIADLTVAFGGTAGRQTLFFGSNTGGRGNNYTPEFLLAGAGYSSTAANAGVNLTMTSELVARESARVMIASLQRSNLPKYLKDFFNTLTPAKMSEQDVNNALAYAQALKQTRDALTETRTPMEVLNANVADLSKQLGTTANRYKTDFVKAIDRGLSPEAFAKWGALGQLLDQLNQAEAEAAAQRQAELDRLRQSWQGLTDSIFAEVSRIRGLMATPAANAAQFATLTAMARAGDQEAAKLLPGVARAVLDTAALTASNATDLARIQGRTAASLEGTGTMLASKYGLTIPAYATGGVHDGGVRLVGELGPELEFTGPSRVVSNSESRKMLDNTGVIAAVDALRGELRAIGIAVSNSTQKTAKILDRWDGDGIPEVREAA